MLRNFFVAGNNNEVIIILGKILRKMVADTICCACNKRILICHFFYSLFNGERKLKYYVGYTSRKKVSETVHIKKSCRSVAVLKILLQCYQVIPRQSSLCCIHVIMHTSLYCEFIFIFWSSMQSIYVGYFLNNFTHHLLPRDAHNVE